MFQMAVCCVCYNSYMSKDIEYWLNLSLYDIQTAKAMFKAGRYLYVLFTCQQAVEKILKALVVQNTEKLPPRIHDLVKLSDFAKIELPEDKAEFLAKLNFYYLETRYPEQVVDLSKDIKKETAGIYLSKTEGVLNWLKTKIV